MVSGETVFIVREKHLFSTRDSQFLHFYQTARILIFPPHGKRFPVFQKSPEKTRILFSFPTLAVLLAGDGKVLCALASWRRIWKTITIVCLALRLANGTFPSNSPSAFHPKVLRVWWEFVVIGIELGLSGFSKWRLVKLLHRTCPRIEKKQGYVQKMMSRNQRHRTTELTARWYFYCCRHLSALKQLLVKTATIPVCR